MYSFVAFSPFIYLLRPVQKGSAAWPFQNARSCSEVNAARTGLRVAQSSSGLEIYPVPRFSEKSERWKVYIFGKKLIVLSWNDPSAKIDFSIKWNALSDCYLEFTKILVSNLQNLGKNAILIPKHIFFSFQGFQKARVHVSDSIPNKTHARSHIDISIFDDLRSGQARDVPL